MQTSREDLNKVKVKNFPQTFSASDKKSFMVHLGAIDVRIERDFVIAEFKNESEAVKFVKSLHQKEILGRRLRVEYFTKQQETKSEPIPWETPSVKTCPDYVLKWLSINSDLDFNQPPPPYLRYKYPRPTREIIDSICVALESVPKFYTQVLHLMNKMNLPPPFTMAEVQKSKLEKSFVTVSCQTEISNVRDRKRRIWSGGELLSDESEMESDDDEKDSKKRTPDIPLKPPKKSKVVIQNPAKRFLQTQTYPKRTKKEPSSVFESSVSVHSRKITVNVPSELNVGIEQLKSEIPPSEVKTDTEDPLQTISREDLAQNRLSLEQLSILPIFKNYDPGVRSNKLYIKNLAKTVTSEDLQMVYGHFIKRSKDEIEIKLMQSGRMKGQAFITFNTPYDEEDLERNEERMIDKALNETNGFLLKDKPMVVMYGKGS